MDMREYVQGDFIKVEHIRNGPRRERIVGVEKGQFDRPVITLETGDMLTLNVTNTKILIHAYGEQSEEWINKEIELTLGKVPYKGDMVDSVIVMPLNPTRDANMPVLPKPKVSAAEEMDDEIPF
jgi:hypothetical protein